MFSLALLVLLGVSTCSAATRALGGCPKIQPEKDVDFSQLLGTWYSIQQTSNSAPCLRYNITEESFGHYQITETRVSSGFVDAIGFHHESENTADIAISDPSEEGVFDMKVPYDLGNYKVTIFLTDYYNYMAMFSCRTLPMTKSIFHTWSAHIFSREKVLKVEYLEKARSRLSAYNLDPFLLDNTDQSNCAEAGSKGVFVKAAAEGVNVLKDTVGQVADNVVTKVKGVLSHIDSDYHE
ncbi:hypothetical protein RN001_010759 [Aquatica leii]|uniref:Lipocalin/cytosolic fatty-acid binding domain-containing protein n=1 Tax=Aquatica leii TaxID=1421715 RepID=A0AAN7QHQ7_9COLE|nr:hypothetical protein RN001_010759 [Aquatica leii]